MKATDLLGVEPLHQAIAYKTQEPTADYSHATDHFKSECHSFDVCRPCSDDSVLNALQHSEYQTQILGNKHLKEFNIASLNCRGLSSLSNRERLVHLMICHQVDILCVQEPKTNSNSVEIHGDFTMYWSSGVKDDDRNRAMELSRSGKARLTNPSHNDIFQISKEHLGVGIVLSKSARKFLCFIKPISARNIQAQFLMSAGVFDVISTYAPQA